MRKHKDMKANLVMQIQCVTGELALIAKGLKELDLDDDKAVKELNYLGDCLECRSADTDKLMDTLYEFAKEVEEAQPHFDPDAMTSMQENQSLGF